MKDLEYIPTPVGRLVQGSVFQGNTTNKAGEKLVYKSGSSQGQERLEYYVGIAIKKDNQEWANFFQKMVAIAKQDFPNYFVNGSIPNIGANSNFSWKITDGDGLDSTGQPYSNREGFAGCFILNAKTSFKPVVYDNNKPVNQITDGIKRGDYVRLICTIESNKGSASQKAGLYVNLHVAQLVGYGNEIFTTPDFTNLLESSPVANIPSEASSTPVLSSQNEVNLPNQNTVIVPDSTPVQNMKLPPEPTKPELKDHLIQQGYTYEKIMSNPGMTEEIMRKNGWLK